MKRVNTSLAVWTALVMVFFYLPIALLIGFSLRNRPFGAALSVVPMAAFAIAFWLTAAPPRSTTRAGTS
jgi:ABC-type spermidine/putrescine transport system permease subunit II